MSQASGDIDIDLADRNQLLAVIKHHPAGIMRDGHLVKHNSGIYVTDVPCDPTTGVASIDYKHAEHRGYIKLDLLNMSIYSQVRDPAHLDQLLACEPDWSRLEDSKFVERVVHIGNHGSTIAAMPEPINSLARMAMFMAVIRPGKRHLIGQPWKEVAKTIWQPDPAAGYSFKKSHAIAYAHLVAVHMNLLMEQDASK